MVQEIIVYIIGITVVCIIGYKLLKSLFGKRTNTGGGCSNCSCGSNVVRYKRASNR